MWITSNYLQFNSTQRDSIAAGHQGQYSTVHWSDNRKLQEWHASMPLYLKRQKTYFWLATAEQALQSAAVLEHPRSTTRSACCLYKRKQNLLRSPWTPGLRVLWQSCEQSNKQPHQTASGGIWNITCFWIHRRLRHWLLAQSNSSQSRGRSRWSVWGGGGGGRILTLL